MKLIIKGALYINERGDVVVKSLSKTGEYDQIKAEVDLSKERKKGDNLWRGGYLER